GEAGPHALQLPGERVVQAPLNEGAAVAHLLGGGDVDGVGGEPELRVLAARRVHVARGGGGDHAAPSSGSSSSRADTFALRMNRVRSRPSMRIERPTR